MTVDDLKTALATAGLNCNRDGAYVDGAGSGLPGNPLALQSLVTAGNVAAKSATEVAAAVKKAAEGDPADLDKILHNQE